MIYDWLWAFLFLGLLFQFIWKLAANSIMNDKLDKIISLLEKEP